MELKALVSGTQHACYTASEKEFTMSISSEFNPLFNVRRTKKEKKIDDYYKNLVYKYFTSEISDISTTVTNF